MDLVDIIHSSSSDDENDISITTFSSISSGATISSYSSKQLERLLQSDKQKFCILKNESTKKLASWWRSFGYPAVLNEKNEFQRIQGYISCTKCCHTAVYGPSSGTTRLINHADRCSPLDTSYSSAGDIIAPQSTQLTLDNIVVKKNVKITTKEQNEIKELYAKWVCEDMRPYSIVEDKGFERLAQMFVRIGSQHGLIDVKELLRSRQTVGRTVNELAQKYRAVLKNELSEPLKSKSVTIAPDFWTNKYNQQSFLGVNITYVTYDHEFKTIDLFCVPFNGTKSYDLIRDVLKRQLYEYGVIDLTDVNIISDRGSNFVKSFSIYNPLYCFGHRLNNILKICFFHQQKKKKKQSDVSSSSNDNPTTTIRKNNVIPVLEDENSSCDSESELSELEEDHQELNLFNEDTWIKFQKKKKSCTKTIAQQMLVEDIPPDAKKIILLLKQTKKLVKYVKMGGLNQEIKAAGGKTLRQSCIVRWLSLSDLLESVINSFKITKRLLFGKQKQHMINVLDEQCLKQLVMVLKPFKSMMTIIQCGNAPSLHLVSMCYITLKEVLSSYELLKKYNKENENENEDGMHSEDFYDDDLVHEVPGVTWFRERLLLLLKEMFVLDVRHVAATLLHPRYRSLKKFPDHIKNQCYRYVRQQVKQVRDKAELEEQLQQKTLEPPTKKIKYDKNLFSRFESGTLDEDQNNDKNSGSESDEYQFDTKKGDELDRYLLIEIDKSKHVTDPLQFWKNYRSHFPFLSQYARSILSIPATTTNVEREFSTAGWILNQRRTNLKPEEVDKILFVRSMEKQLKNK